MWLFVRLSAEGGQVQFKPEAQLAPPMLHRDRSPNVLERGWLDPFLCPLPTGVCGAPQGPDQPIWRLPRVHNHGAASRGAASGCAGAAAIAGGTAHVCPGRHPQVRAAKQRGHAARWGMWLGLCGVPDKQAVRDEWQGQGLGAQSPEGLRAAGSPHTKRLQLLAASQLLSLTGTPNPAHPLRSRV